MSSGSEDRSAGRSGPPYTARPLGEALEELLDRTGVPVEELVKQMGRKWRFLLRGVGNVDGRALHADELARMRRVFELPPGYFVEEREALVVRELRREPELRDRLYFAIIDKDHRQMARLTEQAGATEDPAPLETEPALLPLAPPTLRQLILVVLDISLATSTPGARDDVDGAIATLLDDLAGSQGSSNFAVGFVTYDERGVASAPPAHPSLIPEGLVDLLWQSVEGGTTTDANDADAPLKHSAIDVAREAVAAFVEEPSDLPLSVKVLLISSDADADSDESLAAAERLEEIPSVAIVAVPPADLHEADALIRHLNIGRSVDHAFD